MLRCTQATLTLIHILQHLINIGGSFKLSHSLYKPNCDGEFPLKTHQDSSGHSRILVSQTKSDFLIKVPNAKSYKKSDFVISWFPRHNARCFKFIWSHHDRKWDLELCGMSQILHFHSPNPPITLIISQWPKHIEYGSVVYLEVNLDAKTYQIAKLDPMCKIWFFWKWKRVKSIAGNPKPFVCS